MRVPALFTLAALALSTAANAAEFITMPTVDGQPAARMEGYVVAGDDVKFARILNTPGHAKTIFLNSPGGDISPALRIGEMFRSFGLETVVRSSDRCVSACALMWLGGARRVMGAYAQIGFHAVAVQATGAVTSVGNALVGAYLGRLGMSDEAVVFMTTAAPSDLEMLSPDDAKRLRLYVEVDDPEPARSEATGRPIEIRPTAQQSGTAVAVKPQVDPLTGLLHQPIESRPMHKLVSRTIVVPLSSDE